LCKKLPDGGAKIQKKIAQIEAALQYVIHVDELVAGLDFNMSQLRLDEKTAEIKQPDMDDTLKALVAKKVQKLQKARTPYSQHSLAIELKPDGTFRGVAPKYRSGAPKFVSFAEAEQINRSTKLAIALQEKEQSSAVVGAKVLPFTRHTGTSPWISVQTVTASLPVSLKTKKKRTQKRKRTRTKMRVMIPLVCTCNPLDSQMFWHDNLV